MTEEQFQYADDILNLFGQNPEGTVFNTDEILEHTGLTKEQFEIGMRIIKPKKFLKLYSNPMETGGDPLIITENGQDFYNETSFVKEHIKRHQQPTPTSITFNTKGGFVYGSGNVGNTNVNHQSTQDKEPWYKKHLLELIGIIVVGLIAAYFGLNN